MSFAAELYTSLGVAASLLEIARILKRIFGIIISHETVRQWVLAAKTVIPRREKAQRTTWHADETYIKIKGNGFWLWIVRCRKTSQVL